MQGNKYAEEWGGFSGSPAERMAGLGSCSDVAIGGAIQKSQKPRMDQALDDLEMAIKGLNAVAAIVSNRTDRVKRPAGPETAGNGAAVIGRALGGPVVSQLDGMTSQVQSITAILQDIVNRLEV